VSVGEVRSRPAGRASLAAGRPQHVPSSAGNGSWESMQDIATIYRFDPEEQRRGHTLVAGADATAPAPLRLRDRLARLEAQHRRSRRRVAALRGLAFAGGLAVAAAAAAVMLAARRAVPTTS
jgi:hypothetical protein